MNLDALKSGAVFLSFVLFCSCQNIHTDAFAKHQIQQVTQRFNGTTTYTGLARNASPFIAITQPENLINQTKGQIHSSDNSDTFRAQMGMGGPMFISTRRSSVDLSSVLRCDPLTSFKVSVHTEFSIAVNYGLFDVLIEEQKGGWSASVVRCFFAKRAATESEIKSVITDLKKNPNSDLEAKYRSMLLNYVYAYKKTPHSILHETQETSNTVFLSRLFNVLIQQGVRVSFLE